MSSGRTTAALACLLALFTGCATRRPRTSPPPAAQVPSLPPNEMAKLIAAMPPEFPPTTIRPIKLDTTAPPEAKTEAAVVEPKHTTHRRVKPAAQDTVPAETTRAAAPQTPPPTPAQSAEVAASQPSENSPIGQLSTANDTSNAGDRHAISEQIDTTENGVNGIKRTLSSDEQKIVAQIRAYISKARDALKADDLDAAKTTANKARQLLDQLLKE